MLLNLHLLVVLDHRFFSHVKTFWIPSKVDSNKNDAFVGIKENYQAPGETNTNTDATNSTMGLKNNAQEPGKTNMNEVHNDEHATAPEKINTSP